MANVVTRALVPTVVSGPMLTHLIGCPVPIYPEDEVLTARVETYRAGSHRMNIDDPRRQEPTTIVTHCVECGATGYVREY